MVERTERTVQEWLAEWQATRMCTVLTGHAGNQNAAKLTRAQKQELKAILAQPPSQTGVHAEFWNVPAIRDVVKILFDARYESDSSYQLLLRFCGMSFKRPDPFDKRRDEQAITRRMAEVKTQVKALLDAGWEVYGRRGPPRARDRDPPHVAPERPTHQTVRGPPVLLRRPLPDQKKVKLYPIKGNQNTEQIIGALDRLQRETGTEEIAVVPGGARFHHAKALTGLYEPGQLLERITPHLPAVLRARPQPRRARLEHRQEQHRHHPTRNPRTNLQRIRLTHHRPHRRPRLRTPPPRDTENDLVS